MGSSTSKDASSASATASATVVKIRRSQSMPARVFQSSCLGGGGGSAHDSDNNHLHSGSHTNQNEENGSVSHDHQATTTDEEEELEKDPTGVLKEQDCDDDKVNGRSSSQRDVSSRSIRLRSRFSSIAGNLSFRLSRAASFGSSSSRHSGSLLSNNSPTTNAVRQPLPSVTRNQQLLPAAASVRRSRAPRHIDVSSPELDPLALCPGTSSGHSSRPQNNHKIVSGQDNHVPVINNNENTGILPDADHHTSRIESADIEFLQSRRANRRIGASEPVERSVRFSRTLSVGRLRDRVFRRSSFTDGLFNSFQRDREVGNHPSQEHRRQVWDGVPDSDENSDISPTHHRSIVSNTMYNSQDDELETSRPREARYHDIMEHRTDFLERRRRIRSQVRALQRLGSRFENISGHERSCILAGQHRSGRCTCRMNNRIRNPDEDTNARASISRIVMLAEALFEVLDEIHQQSVVLSSHPSVSSLGSVPAPKEVVESMPVKMYTKLAKHQLEDVAQCYICLVEYEEGDGMRILPCHHEFHMTCVDKWLKEIHRVCPLCRGDVCRSDTLPSEN